MKKNPIKQELEKQTNQEIITVGTGDMVDPYTLKENNTIDVNKTIIDSFMELPTKCPEGNGLTAMAFRGEHIHNISIIFYNRAYEWFRNLLAALNTSMNNKMKERLPKMYEVLLEDRYYCRNGIYPFIDLLSNYGIYHGADRIGGISPLYQSTENINNAPTICISAYTFIADLCVFERYINLDINAIKSTGLAACSQTYNEMMNVYYDNPVFANLGCFDEYKALCGEIVAIMLANIEAMIDTLYAEAHNIIATQDKLFTGPFASFDQISSAVINERNQKIAVFIKDKANG